MVFAAHYRCGCFIFVHHQRQYIPLVKTEARSLILANASRTSLTQTFVNPLKDRNLEELRYEFPLYDGVSVVSFTCTVNDRVIHGRVKERQKARETYDEAVRQGQTAGLLDQSLDASDVFTMRIGNVPAGALVKVEIVYLGELKHDAEIDGLRFTLPTFIAPRYAASELVDTHGASNVRATGGVSVTLDAQLPVGSSIKTVQSPSHPISVQIGSCSTDSNTDEPSLQKASATLSLGSAEMDKDFILQLSATKLGDPSAVLETHPTIPNQRALMATLVPKFNLPADKPEIVFVCDRSGSMGGGQQIPNLIKALNTFLRSLPVGVKFNICSFGSSYEFLWPRSAAYSQESLNKAVDYVKTFSANFGGTNMYQPVEETFKRRYEDMNLEVFLLTDGEIWDQERLFELINAHVATTKGATRIFSLGIGHGVSHALIEGVARAGNGFAQTVADNEKMDKKVVRMLKGALTPHITDYSLEIKYSQKPEDKAGDDEDFELVEKIESLTFSGATATESEKPPAYQAPKPTLSLFDNSIKDNEDPEPPNASGADGKFDHLPDIKNPTYLQSPYQIPPLFPFHRSNVYVLLSESSPDKVAKSVVLKGTSRHGPLELEIPITVLPENGEMIHQLAARNAVKELEEGRGWIFHAKDSKTGQLLKTQHDGRFSDLVEREAVRLGVTYQVGGKWCSFVAVDSEGGDDQAQPRAQSVQAAVESAMPLSFASNWGVVAPGGGGFGVPPPPKSSGLFGGRPMARMLAAPPPPAAAAISSPEHSKRARVALGSQPTGGLFGAPGAPPPPPPPAPAPSRASRIMNPFTSMFQSAPQAQAAPTDSAFFGAPSAYGVYPPPPPAAPASFASSNSSSPALFGSVSAPLTSATYLPSGNIFGGSAGSPVPPSTTPDDSMAKKLSAGLFSRKKSSASPRADSTWDEEVADKGRGGQQLTGDNLQDIISLQEFSGNWGWTDSLEKITGVRRDAAKAAAGASGLDLDSRSPDILSTVCAVVFLRIKLADEKEAWEMIASKAVSWLEEQLGSEEEIQKWELVLEGLFAGSN
ncbi:unnamed protein product [Clonostachys solani]|uniref:von Willebrand factor A domain-containing protein 5A n=1 Tax=Clonostachys solani TaxID=160281 RepID=A0A9N9W3H0_9HYPO|nr:unnamed protein product [Clonostachys solani]